MKCKKVQKLVTGFLDGELSEKKRSSIAEHLAGCDQCNGQLGEARNVLQWAGTWKERSLSPAFFTRLKARIRAEQEPARQPQSFWFLGTQRALAAVAAATVMFLGGYFVAMLLSGGQDAQRPGPALGRRQPPTKGVASVAPDRAESERLILGVQRIKMVFGSKLSDKAYHQLNEVQRVLAARGRPETEDLAVVEELQRAEALVRQEQYAEARDLLDGIAEDHPAHPLTPYARMTKILATPQRSYGSELLRNTYAMLVEETVGDPKEFYNELTSYPAWMAEIREYGWNKIVESANRLNPLNTLNFLERRILGGEGDSP